jgi:hypothetical protein
MPWLTAALEGRILMIGKRLAGLALMASCGGQTAGTPATTESASPPAAKAAAAPGPACPASWLEVQGVDRSITPPGDAGHVVMHVAAKGTQDYACATGVEGGGWKLVGPDATLADCNGTAVGRHFPSPGGPEWQLGDGTFAVGHKTAQFVPDGKPASVPWLLLQVVGHADSGALAKATYVQRIHTNGGVAPTTNCSAETGTTKVPYTADYYFYGP